MECKRFGAVGMAGNMDNIAWHYNPVRPSDFFIRVELSTYGMPGRFEQLWVKKIGERQFEICCIPFFTYGIALYDVVLTDNDFTFQEVIAKSGHTTIRVVVAKKDKQNELHEFLHDWVENSGCLYEFYSNGYLAVDLPPNAPNTLNTSGLDSLIEAGEILIEKDV
jgi:Domain of unknown function (DUF4265)